MSIGILTSYDICCLYRHTLDSNTSHVKMFDVDYL